MFWNLDTDGMCIRNEVSPLFEKQNIYIVTILSYIMEKTTIQLNIETLGRLKLLKNFERQSYDDLLNNLIDNFEEEELSPEEIDEINKGLDNIRKGKVKSIEQVAKELGISLV